MPAGHYGTDCMFEAVSPAWPNGFPHNDDCDRLTAAIEQDRRETVEDCALDVESFKLTPHDPSPPLAMVLRWLASLLRKRNERSLSPKGTT